MNDRTEQEQAQAGLCASCQHARAFENDRGRRFIRCERSASDPRYPRFPGLPVLVCPGYDANRLE